MKNFPVQKIFYQGETLRVESLGLGVQRLVLARPDVKNAFNEKMIQELSHAIAELAAIRDKEDMRLLLLAGEGSVFCAGADLNYMKEQGERGESLSRMDARILGQLFFKLANFPTPVIAAVSGAAIGGGLGLTVCSDFVLAEEKTIFATSEVLLGLVPGVISPYIVRKIGLAHAAPMMLAGQRFDAIKAHQMGLVQETVPAMIFEESLESVLMTFLRAGPNAARRTKQLLRKVAPLPTPQVFEQTIEAIAQARVDVEAKEGLSAFFEKRTPEWATPLAEIAQQKKTTKV